MMGKFIFALIWAKKGPKTELFDFTKNCINFYFLRNWKELKYVKFLTFLCKPNFVKIVFANQISGLFKLEYVLKYM